MEALKKQNQENKSLEQKIKNLESENIILKKELDAKTKGQGWTPLHNTAKISDVNLMKTILETGNIDLNATDKDGRTILHHAAYNGHVDKVKYLVEKGANFEVQDKSGKSPLDLAIDKQNNEVAKFLQEKIKGKEEENQSLRNENATLKGELEESKSCIAEHETKLKKFNKENESLKQKIKSLENENTPLRGELGKTKTKTNEVPLEKAGKRQFFPRVAYASLAAMVAVGATLSIASGLSVLLIIAASAVSALIAGGITYAISKPTTELKEVDIQDLVQHNVCKA